MPFVFQHGLGADASQPAARVSAETPCRVITLDCPGHGDNAHARPAPDISIGVGPRAPSIGAFVDDVLTIADPSATADLLQAIALDGPGVTAREVARLIVPTLLIACPDDALHPIGFARDLARTLTDAQCVEVVSKSEAPERHVQQVRAAIATFVARVRGDD